LENIGVTGVRNIFVELTYRSTAESTILLTQKPTIDETSDLWSKTILQLHQWTTIEPRLPPVSSLPTRNKQVMTKDNSFMKANYGFESSINNFSKSELKTVDKHTWTISAELEGLQPQRTKIIQPVIYASCFHDTTIQITAKIFADSFAEPISLEADASIEVDRRQVRFARLVHARGVDEKGPHEG
jgi:hypothetical protein